MVDVDDRVRSGADAAAMVAVVEAVLEAEGAARAEVGVVLVDAAAMQALNAEHRGRDVPTDVLSFPIDEASDAPLDGVPRLLGDVVICVPVLEQQARDNAVSRGAELTDLLTHGVLHLLGYDHETDQGEMLDRQDALIDRLAPIPWPVV